MGKVMLLIGAIFLAIGLVFGTIGSWAYFDDRKLADSGVHTDGTVIAMLGGGSSSATYTPRIEFHDTAGVRHEFNGAVGSRPPIYATGDTVAVIYDPDAPDDAMIGDAFDRYFLPMMFGGMGLLFTLIGGGMLVAYWRRRRSNQNLLTSGISIRARFMECYRDTRIRINARHPYRVVAQAPHPATGKLQSFTSEPIWIDLSDRLAGRDVRVMLDPAKPKRHYMDLAEYIGASEMA